MAPSVPLTFSATPVFFSAPMVLLAQFTTLSVPSVQSLAAARVRYLVKLAVVPEPSLRCTTTIGFDGRLTPGLSALISGASHVATLLEKILAIVGADSVSLSTPLTLYEIVMGAEAIGTYRNEPLNFETSAAATRLSEPAKSTRPPWRSVWP